jgi:hypothetical protein
VLTLVRLAPHADLFGPDNNATIPSASLVLPDNVTRENEKKSKKACVPVACDFIKLLMQPFAELHAKFLQSVSMLFPFFLLFSSFLFF